MTDRSLQRRSPVSPAKPAGRQVSWFTRNWFYLALTAIFAAGLLKPEWGHFVKGVFPTSYMVAVAFFLNGLTLSGTALAGSLRQWRVLVAALAIIFMLVPAVTFALRMVIPGGDMPLGHGFQLLAVVPTTLVSAVVITQIARGNSATALYITVMANMLAILAVPPIMQLALGKAGAGLDVGGTSLTLALTVLLPTVVGQLVRRLWRAFVVAHTAPINIASRLTILYFIITGLAALQWEGASAWRWALIASACLVAHIALLNIADLAARLLRADTPTRHAVAICSSQKSLAVANLLYDKLLMPLGPAYGIALLPSIAYYVVETLVDTLLAQRWSRSSHDMPSEEMNSVPSSLPVE